jgi:hypothetical protein
MMNNPYGQGGRFMGTQMRGQAPMGSQNQRPMPQRPGMMQQRRQGLMNAQPLQANQQVNQQQQQMAQAAALRGQGPTATPPLMPSQPPQGLPGQGGLLGQGPMPAQPMPMGMQPSMGPMKGNMPMLPDQQQAMQQRANELMSRPKLGPAGY